MGAVHSSNRAVTRIAGAPRVVHLVSSWLVKVTVAALHGLCGPPESHCQFCENAGQVS